MTMKMIQSQKTLDALNICDKNLQGLMKIGIKTIEGTDSMDVEVGLG